MATSAFQEDLLDLAMFEAVRADLLNCPHELRGAGLAEREEGGILRLTPKGLEAAWKLEQRRRAS